MPDYSKYIKNSFEIVKKQKWLLVYAAVLAGSSGGSFSIANSFADFGKEMQNPQKSTPEKIDPAIGDMANSVLGAFTGNFQQWLHSVPPHKWYIILFLAFFAVLLGIAIGITVANWAKASLIAGIDMSLKAGGDINLENTSPVGVKRMKNLIIFSILFTMTSLIVFISIPIVWGVIFLIVKSFDLIKILWILLGGIVSVGTFLLTIIYLSITRIFAERMIVAEKTTPVKAFSKAFKMTRYAFWSSIVMGLINQTISMFVGIASLILLFVCVGIPAAIGVYIYTKTGEISTFLVTLTALSTVMFIFFAMVVRSSLTVFAYANWNQLFAVFREFSKGYEKQQ